MQRRDFVRTALFGSGAACALALPSAYATLNRNSTPPLRIALAQLQSNADSARWTPIEHCVSAACDMTGTLHVQITALGIPQHFRAFSIDAMFDTTAGLRPFRIAQFQPGAVSPTSKPFSFGVTSSSLAGFRIEHAGADALAVEVAGAALLGPRRAAIEEGEYLLLATADEQAVDVSSLSTDLGLGSAGADAAFAWLRFRAHVNATG
jgi:hypothetical protein